ncbi:MAG: A24 family peptidase [Puniceicoccales bacterium]|jgi:leader peptidase (prepilin peptidase)/N-methyltransferase|nr:A24 family peptidase [Puniceicoccales bacterium]
MCWIHHTVLIFFLAAAASRDYKNGYIPDAINYGGIAVGLLLAGLSSANGLGNAIRSLLFVSGGMFWLAMVFESLTRRDGMGFGDIKLSGILGTFLGVKGSIRVISYAAWIAILHEIFKKKSTRCRQIPFAPHIFYGAIIHEIYSIFVQFAKISGNF